MVIQTTRTGWITFNANLKVIIKQAIKNAPPIGDPKQLDTPTAQAAASISVFLDSFCKTQTNPNLNYFARVAHK